MSQASEKLVGERAALHLKVDESQPWRFRSLQVVRT